MTESENHKLKQELKEFIANHYDMINWENVNQSHVFNIGINQFWEQTFENDGTLNI